MKEEITKLGAELPAHVQQQALNRFVYRFTKNHKPEWANKPWKDGKPYPVQFASDTDWLANTRFHVTEKNELDNRVDSCQSSPTWPDNPELRGKY